MSLNKFEISIITPKEATNLITNPSFETGIAGYGNGGGAAPTLSQSSAYARRGLYSLKCIPGAGAVSGIYLTLTLTTGVQYTASVDILDVAGQTYSLIMHDHTSSDIINSTSWTGTGYWKRRSVTFTSDSGNATHYMQLWRITPTASTDPFYTDGWQLEVGAESTYLDGDMTGFVMGQEDFRWNGIRHASTSYRSPQTRSGGTLTKISTYAKILQIPGLGMGPVENIAVPSTMGGSFYQNTIATDRSFSIICNINKDGDFALIEAARSALINALRPDNTLLRQPLILQIDQLDAAGATIAETLWIECVYQGGLEMDGNQNPYNEKLKLDFTCYTPYLKQLGETAASCTYTENVTANYIMQRDNITGRWSAMGSGMNEFVWTIKTSNDSSIYIGGEFTDCGDGDGDHIVKWNPVTGAFSSMVDHDSTVGGANAAVYAIAPSPDANACVYVGGLFTKAGNVNNTSRIAKWDPVNLHWTPLGTGAADNIVYAIVIGLDGTLYAGGTFTGMGGVANTAGIAKWDGSVWTPMGTGMTGGVYSLAVGNDGFIYAGGPFTLAGGVAGTVKIARWNGSAWLPMGTGMDDTVIGMTVAPDGVLFAGGSFHNAGGRAAMHIASWNGTSWQALSDDLNASVYFLTIDPWGGLIAGGTFTASTGGIIFPDRAAYWNRNVWKPLSFNLPGTASVYALTYGTDRKCYVGFSTSGTAICEYSNLITLAANVGSASVYPKIWITGPGTLVSLKNASTGQEIYFDNLVMVAGEVLCLNLDPIHLTFKSSTRGNIINKILPGSDLNLQLQSGANYLVGFITGYTSATALTATWRATYWSVDGAVR
jgi:hypothetical protein